MVRCAFGISVGPGEADDEFVHRVEVDVTEFGSFGHGGQFLSGLVISGPVGSLYLLAGRLLDGLC